MSLDQYLSQTMQAAREKQQAEIAAARAATNRANALLSTGPTSEKGKRISSHNSLKTGLTGRTVLLPTDDVEAYKRHIAALEAALQPATDAERELVAAIADTQWRLRRIPQLEAGIFLRGRLQFADFYANHEPAEAAALVDAETLLQYEKPLRNLHTQESRLRRALDKDQATLAALQAERRKTEAEATPKEKQPEPKRAAAASAPVASFLQGANKQANHCNPPTVAPTQGT